MNEYINLNKMLERLELVKKLPETKSGTYLHVGCGVQIIPGFINIDKYEKHEQVLNLDMYQLPFTNIEAIYSSHSLEHLPYRLARLALINWGNMLCKGGKVFLAIPDLEETMRILLDPNMDNHFKWGWYIYTLFGYQVDTAKYPLNNPEANRLDLPTDPGQFHQCGFTKDSITMFLQEAGLTVTEIFSYDGWSTPSLWVEAIKN